MAKIDERLDALGVILLDLQRQLDDPASSLAEMEAVDAELDRVEAEMDTMRRQLIKKLKTMRTMGSA
jgi:uncharacterized protein Yka (UPF0111/DUF47 family)